jgi:hypothetical protein
MVQSAIFSWHNALLLDWANHYGYLCSASQRTFTLLKVRCDGNRQYDTVLIEVVIDRGKPRGSISYALFR